MTAAYEKIRELAYRLWQDDGAPDGRAMDYWLQAEAAMVAVSAKPTAEIVAEVKPKVAPKSKAAAKPKAEAKPKAPVKAKTAKA